MSSFDSMEQSKPENYQVVARKYRPQTFEALIGQGHIATALSNAINQSRVGHAYMFTGARGVGKTSSARIFAKCLNCVAGPTTVPCNECDICQSIAVGEDVDVLEIDGASNRGIDEIRSLRSNAAIRPSRARYKIYIIDEVHMLTMQAFNALLKTLEEPPRHVKFIFCTTDPHKIPITVLSRCQRFDFSPVQTNEIASSLKPIVEQEGKTADEEALNLLARRANGSMRDSQSLLEQLFSFCGKHISVDEVHRLLGTADMGRVTELASAMLAHDPATTLALIHQAVGEGIDAGQLAGQLLGFFRDLMAVKIGSDVDTLLTCSSSDLISLNELSEPIGLETILAILQILDAAVVKMQSSVHARTVLEVASIRVCNLENLEAISDLVKQLSESSPPSNQVKRAATSAEPTKPTKGKASQLNDELKKNEIVEPVAPTDAVVLTDNDGTPSESLRADAPHVIMESHSILTSVGSEALLVAGHVDGIVPIAPSARTTIKSSSPSESIFQVNQSVSDSHFAHGRETVDQEEDLEAAKQAGLYEPVEAGLNEAEFESMIPDTGRRIFDDLSHLTTLAKLWDELIDKLQGMTGDMVREPESLELIDSNLIRVTLKDAYKVRECLKLERKQMIESVLSTICQKSIRVDFKASTMAGNKQEPVVPQLPRSQQLRMLLEHEFVKQAVQVFTAEITNFYQPAKSNQSAE